MSEPNVRPGFRVQPVVGAALDESRVKMAAKLYEARDAAKTLLGERYDHAMRNWAREIQYIASAWRCSDLSAATRIAKDMDGMAAVVVLAAYVEMVEPSSNAQVQPLPGAFPGNRLEPVVGRQRDDG